MTGAALGAAGALAGALVGLWLTKKNSGILWGAELGNLAAVGWNAARGDKAAAIAAFATPGLLIGGIVVGLHEVARSPEPPPPVGLAQPVCGS
jgi:hypothetical protein